MSQKKVSARDYNFSDGVLKQEADRIVLSVQRDTTQFTTRGVNTATITAFTTTISAFDNLPTDAELQGSLSVATENKNIAAENLRVAIRSIRTMSENKSGVSSAAYRTFAFGGMNEMGDEELYRLGKRVGRVANTQLTTLASEGLTAAMVTNMNTLATNLDLVLDTIGDATNARDIKTQERIDKGNVVYKEMVRLCNIGKDLFASTDAAKYNDYVIYGTTTPPTPTDHSTEPPR